MKSSLKKSFQISRLNNIFLKKKFLGFFFLHSINVKKRIQLKSFFENLGFQITFFNNKIFEKAITTSSFQYTNLIPISKGSNLLITPIENKSLDVKNLQNLFFLLKKEKSLFFLGGMYENSLVNSSFVDTLLLLEDNTITLSKIYSHIMKPSIQLSALLSEIPKQTSFLIQKNIENK